MSDTPQEALIAKLERYVTTLDACKGSDVVFSGGSLDNLRNTFREAADRLRASLPTDTGEGRGEPLKNLIAWSRAHVEAMTDAHVASWHVLRAEMIRDEVLRLAASSGGDQGVREAPLRELAEKCKAEVSVTINQHRNYYEPVADYLANERFSDVPPDVRAEMIARDTVVEVQFYPDTPVGSYFVAHWDVSEALREAVALLTPPVEPQAPRLDLSKCRTCGEFLNHGHVCTPPVEPDTR